MGYCYYYGRDIPVDDGKAFNCYMHGVIVGDANCLYKIGDMYRYGRFVNKDESLAVLFYEWALSNVCYITEDVYPDVCRRIGECALYGIGMKQNLRKALKMLTDAETYTYKKIQNKDPFAASLLPKIQEMLAETKKLLNGRKKNLK